ncbi:MAG: hypothetical protein FJ270_05730 [Planctomycetes bacterium]|nr:hypothetical protein [Planctomycetota bacterium]
MFGPSPSPLEPRPDWSHLVPAVLRNPRTELEAGFTRLRTMLQAEGTQTREMLEIYGRATQGQASSADIDRANRQFGDLLRLAGLGAFFAVVPGSALLLPLAVTTARRLGINLLPDSWEQQAGLPVDGRPDEQVKPRQGS